MKADVFTFVEIDCNNKKSRYKATFGIDNNNETWMEADFDNKAIWKESASDSPLERVANISCATQ